MYLQVLVPKKPEFKGKMIEVDIYEAGKHYMKGRPVEDAQVFTASIAQPLQKGQVSGLPQVSLLDHIYFRLACSTLLYSKDGKMLRNSDCGGLKNIKIIH